MLIMLIIIQRFTLEVLVIRRGGGGEPRQRLWAEQVSEPGGTGGERWE